MSFLTSSFPAIRARIAAAAQRAGRDPAAVTLVAVSKTRPAETVTEAIALGQVDFGENRIEEAAPKMHAVAQNLPPGQAPLRWHMIGHIQTRKVSAVVAANFDLVHSVDSDKLGERLGRLAQAAGRRQAVLLECNVSGEAAKAGFALADPAQWPAIVPVFEQLAAHPGLRVLGLMTMAPIVDDPAQARPVFRRLAALQTFLRHNLPGVEWQQLSMGMTDDFEVAVEEGATLVRVGRALFGEQP